MTLRLPQLFRHRTFRFKSFFETASAGWGALVFGGNGVTTLKVLGLDPGSAKMGYGIIEPEGESIRYVTSGILEPPAKIPFAEKLFFIQKRLLQIIKEHQPDVVVVEKAFFGKNAESAFKLGQVRGVCLSAAASYRAEVAEVAAKRVKKLVTGNGAAEKTHVQLIVASLLGVNQFASLDESDALAMAIAFHREHLATQVLERNLEAQS